MRSKMLKRTQIEFQRSHIVPDTIMVNRAAFSAQTTRMSLCEWVSCPLLPYQEISKCPANTAPPCQSVNCLTWPQASLSSRQQPLTDCDFCCIKLETSSNNDCRVLLGIKKKTSRVTDPHCSPSQFCLRSPITHLDWGLFLVFIFWIYYNCCIICWIQRQRGNTTTFLQLNVCNGAKHRYTHTSPGQPHDLSSLGSVLASGKKQEGREGVFTASAAEKTSLGNSDIFLTPLMILSCLDRKSVV